MEEEQPSDELRAREESAAVWQERFRLLMEATRDALFDCEVPTGACWWSPRFAELLRADGVPRDLRAWFERIHPEDRPRADQDLASTLRDSSSSHLTRRYRVRRDDDTWAHVLEQGRIVRDEGGRALRIVGAIADVTSETAALRRNEARFRRLVENATHAVTVFSSDYRAMYDSPNVEAILGHARALGSDVTADVHPDDLPSFVQLTERSRPGETIGPMRYRAQHATGRWVWIECLVRNLTNDEEIGGLVANWSDVTTKVEIEQDLERHRERLELAVTGSSDGLFDVDVERKAMWISPRLREMLGTSDEEILAAQGFADLVHPGDRECTRALVQRTIEHGEPYEAEVRLLRRDGTTRWIRARARRIIDRRGRVRFAGSVADVTERKRDERRLEEAEEVAGIGGWEVDLATGQLAWTPGSYRVFGVDPRTFEPSVDRLVDSIPNEDAIRIADAFARLRLGEPYDIEHQFVRPDGTLAYVRSIGKPEVENGRVVRVHGINQDVTVLREKREMLAQQGVLLEQVQDAIIAVDLEGRVMAWNKGAERIHGWTAEEMIGTPVGRIYPAEHETWRRANLLAPLAREGRAQAEVAVVRKDGEKRTVLLTLTQLRDERGRVTGTVGYGTDVTERQRLEERLRQAQKMEAVGLLAGGVAHDFNNILTVIQAGVEELAAGTTRPDTLAEIAQDLAAAADRGGELTRQLLAFSRRQILAPKNLDVNRVVLDVSRLLRRVIGEHIRLACELAPDIGLVHADPTQIEQVLLNLAVNARDAMPRGGKLVITTRAATAAEAPGPGEWIAVAIRDTGIGMDDATLSRVFEPFFTTKAAGRGTGLGLATVYGIVKQSGGEVRVESVVDKGSTFTVLLPRIESANETPREAVRETARGGDEIILLVEDDDHVRGLVVRMLQRRGYDVIASGSPFNARAIAADPKRRIDLLITDVVMPEQSGRELAVDVLKLRPSLPVLFVSGYTDDAELLREIRDEGRAVLAKPFTGESLASKVREMLDAQRSSRPPIERRL